MLEITLDEHIEAVVTPQTSVMQDPMFNQDVATRVFHFHASMSNYEATPLVNLKRMACEAGVGSIFVKDESKRFGLNAFKVVGGIFGLANVIAKYLDLGFDNLSFDDLKSARYKDKLDAMTIVSVTDGNHGRGLAWAGKELGCKVVIHMPKGSALARVNALRELGAEVHITDLNYDDTLRVVIDTAAKDSKLLHVQDQAWAGYEEIPNWISQGYMTIAHEALTQLYFGGEQAPTHIFLQAGAGSMALGIAAFFANALAENCPKIILMEAKNANCYFKSMKKGEPVRILGDLETIMAGLSVGEMNTEAYRILPHILSGYLSCSDAMSKYGTRLLAAPSGDDAQVVSGESGSIGVGVLNHLMRCDHSEDLRKALELDHTSRVLLFNTEGDTDPALHNSIVYDHDHHGEV
ncbi:diaminopropionate ammonia-lyase [Pseudovibrio sp. Tun.PSC04-5.I4]|uniref:diaminopropionate ammonia-lyase n=1 Tax=Pseudovibrio sp. Tun.PSC04-5.I4 TaxID=1798213 RepID=UPI0008821172|nr:diaminopropionate ammonia-lyase [Pseudovibrio sp. Tun.PSC04-5.I4]SDQ73538.1 diaminopropionate ammonia-lyase [Pseudovibrio sp. Tun.PSC04-5.I4]